MSNAELMKALAEKDEKIAELKAEILDLKTESVVTSPIEQACMIINDCLDEDGEVDYEKFVEEYERISELQQYLSVYLLFNGDDNVEIEEI